MQKIKWIALACAIVTLLIMNTAEHVFDKYHVTSIAQLEFQHSADGFQSMVSWSRVEKANLFHIGKLEIYHDFLFILSYLIVLVSFSNNEMYKQRNATMGNFLRLNLLLAFLVALLDTVEDLTMLWNFNHWQFAEHYTNTLWVTWPKFLIGGWIIVVWLISSISRGLRQWKGGS